MDVNHLGLGPEPDEVAYRQPQRAPGNLADGPDQPRDPDAQKASDLERPLRSPSHMDLRNQSPRSDIQ